MCIGKKAETCSTIVSKDGQSIHKKMHAHAQVTWVKFATARLSTSAVLNRQSPIMPLLPTMLHKILGKICKKFADGESGSQVVAYKDQIVAACNEHGYARTQLMHCKSMGCHPKNRDRAGIHLSRAHSRISKIVAAGCSESALCMNRIGIEDNPRTKHSEKFMMEVCSGDEQFAVFREGDIKAGTLGASHTTHGMAMLYDERPCEIEGISEDGRMSHNLCFKHDNQLLKQYTLEGMNWTILRWEVEEDYPVVPTIIQAALNTVSAIAAGESFTQILLKIAKECELQKLPNGDVNVRQVCTQVQKSQPPRANDIPDLVDYVRTWGGLPSAVFINELKMLSQTFASDRIVAGTFFKWLYDCRHSFPVAKLPSHFINAVLYTHASANVFIVDDIARFITQNDVKAFTKKETIPVVMKANEILARGKELTKELGMRDQLKLIPKFKVAIVLKVMARTDKNSQKESRSLDEIATDFAEQVCTAIGVIPHEASKPSEEPRPSVPSNVVLYNEDGSTNAAKITLENTAGFKVGSHVHRRDEEAHYRWEVHQIGADGFVDLFPISIYGVMDPHRITHISIDELIKDYKQAPRMEVCSHYPTSDPINSEDLQARSIAGQVQSCLYALTMGFPQRMWSS